MALILTAFYFGLSSGDKKYDSDDLTRWGACLRYTEGADREPFYQGRALSDWLDQYAMFQRPLPGTAPKLIPWRTAQHDEAVVAIKQIGTNAVPALFDMLRYGDSRRVKWGEWAYGVRSRSIWLDWVPSSYAQRHFLPPGVAEIKHEYGELGLEVLGPMAVPALNQALNDPNLRVRKAATNALRSMEQQVVPP